MESQISNPHLTALNSRSQQNLLRQLDTLNDKAIDFFSNDYLGLAQSKELYNAAQRYIIKNKSGATGSRLISGNSDFCLKLESKIAAFHNTESALIYNSGYDANLGLFSCIASRHDTILYDENIHASIIDGIRLSLAQSFKFKHNNLEHLRERLQKAKGKIYVAIESVYSMQGDFAPLKEMAALCNSFNANLIVDEAHATGVIGKNGEGMVQHLDLVPQVFCRVHTFGKALGCHGAAIVGSKILINYLINYSRSFIYTTALPQHSLAFIKAAYEILPLVDAQRKFLFDNINYFKDCVKEWKDITKNNFPIQYNVLGGNKNVDLVASEIKNNGINVKSIKSPTVEEGGEGIRICLHAFNTKFEIDKLINSLKNKVNTI